MNRSMAAFALAGLACIASPAIAATPAVAADDPILLRLATCRDSWFEWKDDAAKAAPFVQLIQTRFTPGEQGAVLPKGPIRVLGFPVAQMFPQSVGMAVGFSVLVEGHADKVRAAFEKQLGHAIRCETGDGMKSCEYKIAEKKSAVLMTGDDGRASTTLVGCYYFYEK